MGLGIPAAVVPGVGAVAAIVLATLFSMILGELIPKNFALAVPLATAKIVVPLQIAFTWVFKPIIKLLNGTANSIIRAMGIEPKEELSGARSAEELSFLVRRSAFEGVLDHDDAAILHRTLAFSSHTADEVMTPRVRAIMVPRTATAEDVIKTAVDSGFSRFPVTGEGVDDIIGVVHVKSAYGVDFARRPFTMVTELMSEAMRVPDSAGVSTLLEPLRNRSFQLAVVVDEHGGTAGIVTLEDLVEELLGEVLDEHDDADTDVIIGSGERYGTISISGSLRPDEAWERAGIRIPESEEYETVAGYVLDALERFPDLGEEFNLEHGVLRVEEIDGSRVDRLTYASSDPENDPAFAGERVRLLDTFQKGAEA